MGNSEHGVPGAGVSSRVGVAKVEPQGPEEAGMTGSGETGHITGTKDKDYNIIWFTE